jgi:hypothetical protein
MQHYIDIIIYTILPIFSPLPKVSQKRFHLMLVECQLQHCCQPTFGNTPPTTLTEFRLNEFNVIKLVALLICSQEDLGLNPGPQIG